MSPLLWIVVVVLLGVALHGRATTQRALHAVANRESRAIDPMTGLVHEGLAVELVADERDRATRLGLAYELVRCPIDELTTDGDLRAVVRELEPAYVAYRTDEYLVVGGVAPLELPSHWPAAAAVDT